MAVTSGSPNMGVKVMNATSPVIHETECNVEVATALRHFIQNRQTLRRLRDYCLGESPSYSLKVDMNKTKDFHTFKSSTACQRHISEGAGVFSPTQMENMKNNLKELGINLDEII